MTEILYYLKQFNPILWATMVLMAISLYYIPDVVMLFSFAFLISYLFSPIVKFFEKRGIARSITAFLITLLIILTIITMTVFIIPVLKNKLMIIAHYIPEHFSSLKQNVIKFTQQYNQYISTNDINKYLNSKFSNIISNIPHMISGVFSGSVAIASTIMTLFIAPISVFFMLKDWPQITNNFLSLFSNPTHNNNTTQELLKSIDCSLKACIRGQALICLTMGIYYSLLLMLVGLNSGILIGIITGLMLFIPYIGNFISFLLCLILAITQFSSFISIGLVVLVFIGGQLLENLYLVPNMMGRYIGVHPVWILFALLFSSKLLGLGGIILTMPFLAIISAILKFYNAHKMHKTKNLKKGNN